MVGNTMTAALCLIPEVQSSTVTGNSIAPHPPIGAECLAHQCGNTILFPLPIRTRSYALPLLTQSNCPVRLDHLSRQNRRQSTSHREVIFSRRWERTFR